MAKSENRDDYQDIERPIGGMAKEYAPGHVVSPHTHPRVQILFAVSGVMEVSTARGVWVVPPMRAAWLPANVEHWMRTRTGASVHSVYIRPDYCPSDSPAAPNLISVSALIRELIVEVTEMPVEYDENGRDGLIAELLISSIEFSLEPPLSIHEPSNAKLLRLHRSLVDNPADTATLEEWAEKLGASSRTIARLIKQETGMSFTTWRQQLRLLAALPRLAAGEPVTNIALDLGYETPGAFSSMFSKQLGKVPSRYFSSSKKK